jgi:hypothetical protein
VNTPAKCLKRRIKRTNDDAEMAAVSAVETNEVAAVEDHEYPLVGDGEGQDFGTGDGPALPLSSEVNRSCPKRRISSATGEGKRGSVPMGLARHGARNKPPWNSGEELQSGWVEGFRRSQAFTYCSIVRLAAQAIAKSVALRISGERKARTICSLGTPASSS